jgi:hypothetical protein
MLEEGRKRDKAANAVLALSFAANAAQSPQSLVKSGHDAAPGLPLMGELVRKRKEANRNLDSARVSEPSRNRKKKTFKEFVEETSLQEAQRHFSSRAELEKHHGGIPSGYYANNAGSTESPKWRLKPKAGGVKEKAARAERIASLSSPEEREKAGRKVKKIQRKGYEAHHITPTHHSAKLKGSMSDAEWKERVERDKKIGVYHGHQPRNLMAAKGPKTPADKPGIKHRKGGAHEVEGKVKDIVSGPGSRESAISHRDLLAAAVRKQRREAKKNK